MSAATKTDTVITKKDLFLCWLKWSFNFYPSSSYVRYYGVAFCWSIAHILKKLYKNNHQEYVKALQRESSFIITEAGFGMVIHGIILAMEEQRAKGEDIPDEAFINIKTALMGPIAGFGDSIFDSCLRVMLIAIFQPLAGQGVLAAPLLATGGLLVGSKLAGWFMLPAGLNLGRSAVEQLLESGVFKRIIAAAAVVSMFIMGSMSANYVSFKFAFTFADGAGSLQAMIDNIIPGFCSIGPVLLIYKLLQKNVGMVKIILGIVVSCLLLSLVGLV